LGATPAGESGGGNTIAAGEDHSSEGYTTPRSLETPVQVNISMKIKNVLLVFPRIGFIILLAYSLPLFAAFG
jgi:hypothetical protein